MPVPVCRTVKEAYDAGVADAMSGPQARPELAARVAGLLAPVLEDMAAWWRPPPLLTVAQAGAQLGLGATAMWGLIRTGLLVSVEIPSPAGEGKRVSRRISQAEVEAFIDRHTVRP